MPKDLPVDCEEMQSYTQEYIDLGMPARDACLASIAAAVDLERQRASIQCHPDACQEPQTTSPAA